MTTSLYPNLESNHDTHYEKAPTGEALIIVTCPGVNEETKGLETSWDATEPVGHITCLFCDWLNRQHLESPEHGDGDAT